MKTQSSILYLAYSSISYGASPPWPSAEWVQLYKAVPGVDCYDKLVQYIISEDSIELRAGIVTRNGEVHRQKFRLALSSCDLEGETVDAAGAVVRHIRPK